MPRTVIAPPSTNPPGFTEAAPLENKKKPYLKATALAATLLGGAGTGAYFALRPRSEPAVCGPLTGPEFRLPANPAPLFGRSAPDPTANCRPCKRGVGSQFGNVTIARSLGAGVRWFYTWGTGFDPKSSTPFQDLGLEFRPMIWGRWFNVDAAVRDIPRGARFLLGFNEPNHRGQANLSPEHAAALWPQVEGIARRRNLVLVSPAAAGCGGGLANCVTEGTADRPGHLVWFDRFFQAVNTTLEIEYLATHIYSCELGTYRAEVERLYAEYQRKIMLTELACFVPPGPRNRTEEARFVSDLLDYLEGEDKVHSYAWFGIRSGTNGSAALVEPDSTALTPVGRAYAQFRQPSVCTLSAIEKKALHKRPPRRMG